MQEGKGKIQIFPDHENGFKLARCPVLNQYCCWPAFCREAAPPGRGMMSPLRTGCIFAITDESASLSALG